MWSYSAACFFGFSLLADRCGRRQAFEYLLFVVQIVAIQYDHPYRIWAGGCAIAGFLLSMLPFPWIGWEPFESSLDDGFG
jgi:hypothetical protein